MKTYKKISDVIVEETNTIIKRFEKSDLVLDKQMLELEGQSLKDIKAALEVFD